MSVLVVDDDDVAQEAVLRALRKQAAPPTVVPAEDGLVALQILRGEHPARILQPPFVVLLDLNMPRMNGQEFLRALRDDGALRDTVVYVLSTSNTERDRAMAHGFGVAGYLEKDRDALDPPSLGRLLARHAPT
jgi:CheY-like chemotaxis protein